MKITNLDPDASAKLAAGTGGMGTPTGGDLSGPLPNPRVVAIQGVAIDATPGTTGDVLTLVDPTHADWEAPTGGTGILLANGLVPSRVSVVLTAGPASFDAGMVESPSVWWDEPSQRYGMVYTGYDAAISAASIGLAWSEDGVIWTKDGASPILSGSGSGFDSAGCTGPVMWYEGGTYYLFYIGLTSSGYEGGTPSMGLATASSVTGAWTRLGQIIAPSGSGWRQSAVYHASIVKVGSTYYCFFNAKNAGGTESIGYATSSDLTSWTVDDVNSPLLSPSGGTNWDGDEIGDPSVIRIGDAWFMGYFGTQASYTNGSDGFAWTMAANFPLGWTRWTYNPVLAPGSSDAGWAAKPCLFLTQSQLLHYYTSIPQPNSVIALAVSDIPVPTAIPTSAVVIWRPLMVADLDGTHWNVTVDGSGNAIMVN